MLAFPPLGDEFSKFVAERIHENLRRSVPVSEVAVAFERFQNQPRLLIGKCNAPSNGGKADEGGGQIGAATGGKSGGEWPHSQ